LEEVFLAAYPRLCQEAAGRLRTLPNPADYPPVEEVRSPFTFSWQYVSYGVPEQLREISSRMFQTERDKAVQAMSEACAEVQQVMRASLLELVSHLRDRLADQPDGKPHRLPESTLQKLRDFLATFDWRNVVDDQDWKEQVDKARALLEGVSTDALRNMPRIRSRVRKGMAELAAQMDVPAGDRVIRQPFARSELGLNKAIVLVNRLNLFWGLKWEAIPVHLQPGTFISRNYSGDDLRAHIGIGCDLRAEDRPAVLETHPESEQARYAATSATGGRFQWQSQRRKSCRPGSPSLRSKRHQKSPASWNFR
jgi:hypothetical protein